MRTPRLLVAAVLVLLAGVACSNSSKTATTPSATTTTTDPVDRAAVDALIDQIAPAFKPLLNEESGDVAAKDISANAATLGGIADGLKDPTKRPRGVPDKVLDDLGTALGNMSTAAASFAKGLPSCPPGISTPRCTDLYLGVNQGQTALNASLQALQPYGTRSQEQVQALLYS
jgi:hypothetical protein